MSNFGTVKFSGKELKLTEAPYVCSQDDDFLYFEAHAEDSGNTDYLVSWAFSNDDYDHDQIDDLSFYDFDHDYMVEKI